MTNIIGKVGSFIQDNFSSFYRLSKWGFNAGTILTLAGFFSGVWTISCGMITMGCSALLYFLSDRKNWKISKLSPETCLIAFIPLSVLISCLGTNDWHFAWDRIRVNLGFLLIPLILFCAPPLSVAKYRRLLVLAGWGAILSLIAVGVLFLKNQDTMLLLISQGHPIPTPVNHIRYSMVLSFTALGFFYSWLNHWRSGKRIDLVYFLLISIGILALPIRTGWLILVAGIVFIIALKVFYSKQWKYLLLLVLTLGITLVFLWLLPTSRQKILYMSYDLGQIELNDGSHYSDSDRFNSLINSIDLIRQHPFSGIGTGDRNAQLQENAQKLSLHLPVQIPHNQFLYSTLFGGIISLFFFLIGYFYPLFYKRLRQNQLIILLLSLFTVTMLYEPTFETSLGVLLYNYLFIILVKGNIENGSNNYHLT